MLVESSTIAPHGGNLVDRRAPEDDREELAREALGLPRVALDASTTSVRPRVRPERGKTLSTPPNILYVHSHDTGRWVRPYGYAVRTPNIQRLAEEGVILRKAFCAAPTCSGSRACLLTGQYAHSNGW